MHAKKKLPTILLLALATATTFAQAQVPAGTIKRLTGESQVLSASGARAAEVGGTVYSGDRVVTGKASAVGLTLHDGTQLAVGPGAAVTLQNYAFDSTTRNGSLLVDVSRGAMRMVSGLIARQDPGAVGVTTPTATIGVRGTDFLVDVQAPADSR